jgi:hypothetical protein
VKIAKNLELIDALPTLLGCALIIGLIVMRQPNSRLSMGPLIVLVGGLLTLVTALARRPRPARLPIPGGTRKGPSMT